MLSYAFQTLKQETYDDVAVESFDEMYNLLAAILAKGIGMQLKQGLYREYISHQEELTVMRGKINMPGINVNIKMYIFDHLRMYIFAIPPLDRYIFSIDKIFQ